MAGLIGALFKSLFGTASRTDAFSDGVTANYRGEWRSGLYPGIDGTAEAFIPLDALLGGGTGAGEILTSYARASGYRPGQTVRMPLACTAGPSGGGTAAGGIGEPGPDVMVGLEMHAGQDLTYTVADLGDGAALSGTYVSRAPHDTGTFTMTQTGAQSSSPPPLSS